MELTIGQLIKITIGIFVVVVVVGGLYVFGSYISDFFGNLPGDEDNSNEIPNNDVDAPQEEKSQEPSSDCSSCGEGFFNLCDEEECRSLGECTYSADIAKGSLNCEPVGNEK